MILLAGLPGQGLHLGLDPLSALFLCILGPQVIATGLVMYRFGVFWVLVGAMGLALLAADAFTLIFGFGLMSAAYWLVLLRADRRVAALFAGVALFAGACLIPAVFLAPGGVAFLLVLTGAGAKAGLAPLHAWLPRAHVGLPAGVSALMSGAMVLVPLYIIIRYGFMVFGVAVQPWWGVALVVAGGASALLGAVRSVLEVELKTVLACSTVGQVGLIAVGLGIGLYARAMDDTALAVLALQGALLMAVAHGLFKPLLFLGAGVVERTTSTTSLDWLGGLMRAMPWLGGLMLLGCVGLAALPFGPGFAPAFLLLHAVFAAAGTGGLWGRIGFAAVLAVLGLSAALGLAAAVRMIGIGFLGRPRSLRAAAAEETKGPPLWGMAVLAGCCVPVSLLPGVVLQLLQPVLSELVPGAVAGPLGYAPLPLLGLMLALAGAAYGLLQHYGVRGEREVQAWNGGFGRPPVWLPFGDPATQASATGFAEPVRRGLGHAVLGGAVVGPGMGYVLVLLGRWYWLLRRSTARMRRPTLRERLAVVLAVLVAFLLVLGIGQGG